MLDSQIRPTASRARSHHPARTPPDGFSLTEMLIALVILTVAILSITAYANRTNRTAATPEHEAAALQALNDRMSTVLHHPTYSELDRLFDAVEDSVTQHGFRRTTDIERRRAQVGDDETLDYTEITVTVAGPGLGGTISRSAAVAAP